MIHIRGKGFKNTFCVSNRWLEAEDPLERFDYFHFRNMLPTDFTLGTASSKPCQNSSRVCEPNSAVAIFPFSKKPRIMISLHGL